MGLVNLVCTGCSCLCDDIQVEIQGGRVVRVDNACAEGDAHIRSSEVAERRLPSTIENRTVTTSEAVDCAVHLLQEAHRPLIFGLDRSTLEAQALGMELARALKGTIDDSSSLHYGDLIQGIESGNIPTGSLAEAQDADLFLYWGANPYHSHPRHLSKYTYYAREQYHAAGWVPAVTLSCVEVRDTETSILASPTFKIEPGGDRRFIEEVLPTVGGAGPTERASAFVRLLEKHKFAMVFVGLGLNYALDNNFTPFQEMVKALSRELRLAVIPMVDEFNMRGCNRLLYQKTGYVNRINFSNGISHGDNFSFLEAVANKTSDCILVVDSDPVSNLPYPLMQNLRQTNVICLNPFVTPTTSLARVTIGTAVPGVETGGTALRMDGEKVSLSPARETERPGGAEILRQLLGRFPL